MLLTMVLAVWLAPAQGVSLSCANPGAAQGEPVNGPGGVTALLRLSSADDHSKNSHECEVHYELVIRPAGGEARVVDALTSDGEWGREVSARVSGFSRDGRRVLGILTEDGKDPLAMVFVGEINGGGVAQLIDLKEKFAGIVGASCRQRSVVSGTTESGGIVVSLSADGACAASGQWVVDAGSKKARRMTVDTRVEKLYGAE